MISLEIKKTSEEDTEYSRLTFVAPELMYEYYSSDGTPDQFTLRDQIEVNCEASEDHTVRLHYIKKWDIATDTTNWLLTNYQDAYIYGSLMEGSAFIRDDARIGMWQDGLYAVMKELNDLDHRSRDDAVLGTDVYELSSVYSTYNVIKDT
jgi:hypothetical protein